MKKYFALIFILTVAVVWSIHSVATSAQTDRKTQDDSNLVSPNVVISQIYGGGGAAGAQYTNDFVELYNRGRSATSINGWSVQYAGATSTNWIV
ncbi:MAG: lamin tail domain-containing protein, partial [Flavisolibacter sp.]